MLKLLACIFMLLDHIGFFCSDLLPAPVVVLLRSLGRLAFPVFAWLVARGCRRTRNLLRYFVRMSVFAIVSEVIIRAGNSLSGLLNDWVNVLVTFSLSIVLISGYRLVYHAMLDMIASLRPVSPTANTLPAPPRFDVRINIGGLSLDPRVGLATGLVTMAAAILAALWLKPDYGLFGVLAVLLFYIIADRFPERDQEKRSLQGYMLLMAIFLPFRLFVLHWTFDWAILQSLSILAIPLCYALEQERKPGLVAKYFFYLFYPLHILVLQLLQYWLTYR